MADVPEQLGFYERMLPERERPLDALGGILNGLGAGCGILALIWWPLLLGTMGVGLAGLSLVFDSTFRDAPVTVDLRNASLTRS